MQNYEPDFHSWFGDLCYCLVWNNCECVIRFEVALCGWHDVNIWKLTCDHLHQLQCGRWMSFVAGAEIHLAIPNTYHCASHWMCSVLVLDAEIQLTISIGYKALDISIGMPLDYRGMTRGLLGNFNGVTGDDFVLPDGTTLASDLTDRQIYEDFGPQCKLFLALVFFLSLLCTTNTCRFMFCSLTKGPARSILPFFLHSNVRTSSFI